MGNRIWNFFGTAPLWQCACLGLGAGVLFNVVLRLL